MENKTFFFIVTDISQSSVHFYFIMLCCAGWVCASLRTSSFTNETDFYILSLFDIRLVWTVRTECSFVLPGTNCLQFAFLLHFSLAWKHYNMPLQFFFLQKLLWRILYILDHNNQKKKAREILEGLIIIGINPKTAATTYIDVTEHENVHHVLPS